VSKLLDLTLKAARLVDELRNPDLSEWITAIDPVLEALGQPMIRRDSVDRITVGGSVVYITTSYSTLGCHQTDEMEVPISVIEAENPVRAAKTRYLAKQVWHARYALAKAHEKVLVSQQALDKAVAEMNAFKGGLPSKRA
jgi:hypothetical protein